ncbi:hypothetical protein Sjap_007743 [Stephania japonica]|uniref:Uncharacterized protein n=1 Tax=Stephania japonica TaxID=461633 RepID=A0AAP0JNT2_9MAGN
MKTMMIRRRVAIRKMKESFRFVGAVVYDTVDEWEDVTWRLLFKNEFVGVMRISGSWC